MHRRRRAAERGHAASAGTVSRFDLTRGDLAELLAGEEPYRVAQVWEGMYRGHREPSEMTMLPKPLRARLCDEPRFALAWDVAAESSSDGGTTRKWLLRAADGSSVETVLMAYPRRSTVCVSSQVGCAMACSFCATGQLGFGRQLSTAEIVEQVARAERSVADRGWPRLTNVVFMGMGEPLANYDNVFAALRRCNEEFAIGARSMTVSTVGVVPGIKKMKSEALQVNLAVSLHAANDALRDRLVPLNRRYPLEMVMRACEEYCETTHRRISFEWACIGGVNDTSRDARELASLARRLRAHVNLIPLNPTPGYATPGSSTAAVAAFRGELDSLGVNVTVRDTRGRDVDAACGQLAAGLAPGGLRLARSPGRPPGEVATSASRA
ncbi:MAG: 23S rRNA (adenine(2503)-C(2))-methyltransferase RlmN [Acidimicrobiales bacterium]